MKLTLRDRRWDPEQDDAKSLWDRLNEGWRDLRGLVTTLDRRQTFRTLTITGPIASLTVDMGPRRPLGVQLVSLYETSTNATSAVTFSWTWGDAGMTTTSFSALPAGEYRVTFLVMGGA